MKNIAWKFREHVIGVLSLSHHPTMIAIRNGQMALLPYVLVMGFAVFMQATGQLFRFGTHFELIFKNLSYVFQVMFPHVMVLSLAWHLNRREKSETAVVGLVTLMVFWVLSGWEKILLAHSDVSLGLEATWAVYPSIAFTQFTFVRWCRHFKAKESHIAVLGEVLTANIRYLLPAICTVIAAIGLRMLFQEFGVHINAAKVFGLLDAFPYWLDILIFVFVLHVLWFFAIHGYWTLASLYFLIGEKGDALGSYSLGFLTLYTVPGGSGAMLCLLIVILISRSTAVHRKLALVSSPVTLFNISEPLIFGIPIVFNPRMVAAYISVPMVNTITAMIFLEMGWVPEQINKVDLFVPIFLNSYYAFGGINVMSMTLQLICLLTGIAIYGYAWRRFGVTSTTRTLPDISTNNNDQSSEVSAIVDVNAWDLVAVSDTADRYMRHEKVHRTLSMVKKGQLFMMYQPFYQEREGAIHAEALLRLKDVDGTIQGPAFLEVLRQYPAAMAELERWIICSACSQASRWHQLGISVEIFINVTPLFFSDKETFDYFLMQIKRCPAGSIGIEVTEQTVVDNIEDARLSIRKLKAMGVRIALDDFGTGYSSFTYLTDLNPDIVKIDRSLVQSEAHDNQMVMRAIVDLCKNLKLKVVAEGVEIETQAQFIKSLGVDYMQGYLFSRPLTVEKFTEKFKAKPR
ncbi:EAL domain-containing protein [Stenotrophobium rhamnosiphilum]|uniref:EAL domain-containing protein n=1 Tax=Stenotrophobium rhamnosiphilum TaxID=2029166 RepID=A0A2T5MGA2_9GAMM|nr:EAL domain-containing protein [Stenotrophobium rhamnosiphilum]PTU31615.1 hypothetical protein CJD38_09870 [Stenotrophobium rhamnosiphilum]